MRPSQIVFLCSVFFLCAGFSGCLNPFAPVLGDPSASLWTDQQTIGGLLDNFRYSYILRDSLRYSDCLDENFTFIYFDVTNGWEDSWGRDTDLKATGGLFRNFDEIQLTWYAVPDSIRSFDEEETELEFDASFSLSLYGLGGGSSYDLYGFAQFTVYKEEGDRFRILEWSDDTVF